MVRNSLLVPALVSLARVEARIKLYKTVPENPKLFDRKIVFRIDFQ